MIKIFISIIAVIVISPVALIKEYLFVRSHRQEINMKKRTTVLSVFGSIILIFVTASGWFIYKADFEKSEIEIHNKGSYRLTIYQIGAPAFPFGDGRCRFVLNKDDKRIDEMEIRLANDGKWPDEDNFDVEWNADSVSITAHGEEQEDKTYVLYFDSSMYVLDKPQILNANFDGWDDDGFWAIVCDPLDNDIFPDGAKLKVLFNEDTYIIDIDGSVTYYDPDRKLFEPKIGNKLNWSEGMVIQIEFTAYKGYVQDNGYHNLAAGRKIENVDVIVIDAD